MAVLEWTVRSIVGVPIPSVCKECRQTGYRAAIDIKATTSQRMRLESKHYHETR